jgi:uncharacterized membrane protein
MKQSRLDALSDGIFAIVMTILVFEIRIPELTGLASNHDLVAALLSLTPLFLSYLLSFSLLFTYWRSHHFIASVLAQNIDIKFSNFNALFFFFVGLVPFSSHLLGIYSYSQVAIIFFAINIICIGLSLYEMRKYVINSSTIKNTPMTRSENEHANMRILFPVGAALMAIIVSFFDNHIALFLFTIAIIFNLSRRSTRYIFYFIDFFRKEKKEYQYEDI